MGFRGEALSSIAAISELEVTTRSKKSELATKALYNNLGQLKCKKYVAGNQGTTILVKNIFYNLPERRTILEKNTSLEIQRIHFLIKCFSLHFFNSIRFSLYAHVF